MLTSPSARAALAGLALTAAGPAAAQESDYPATLDLSFTGNSMRLAVGRVTNYQAIDAEGTRSRVNGGFVIREAGRRAAFAGAYVEGSIRNTPLTGGVGPRAWLLRYSDFEGSGLTVGGYARASVPDLPEAGLRIGGFITPPVVVGGDLDSLREISVRGEYDLFPQATAYGGLRQIRVNGDDGHVLDEGLMVGLALAF